MPTTQNTTQRRKQTSTLSDISTLGKVPPQALDMEEAVLGALMLQSDAVNMVIDILKPEAFYTPANKMIYQAIRELFGDQKPIDIMTVTELLRTKGELDIVGGAYYIATLTSRVSSAANVEYHARIIAEKFLQRELIRVATETITKAYDIGTDPLKLLNEAEQSLFDVAKDNFKREASSMEDLVRKALEQIEESAKKGGDLNGVPSGFTELDRITSGWQPSDLIILAARPGMGKTAFVLTMARNISVQFQRPVAFFSLEMSSVQLVTRLISAETGINQSKLRTAKLENWEWELLQSKTEPLLEAKLIIDDTPGLSIFELRAKCRRFKKEHDIQMVIVDYLQLMTIGNNERYGNREQEISTISRSLKQLAKELNVPVIALSQLNRSVESRSTTSKRPQLSDLRESGAIEQDADMVLFIYRPEYYGIPFENDEPSQGLADIIIAKHRNGALADVRLRFISQFAKFDNLESMPAISDGMRPNENFETIIPSSMNDDKMDNITSIPSSMNNDDENMPF